MATYHDFVPPLDHPKIQGLNTADVYEYSRNILSIQWVQNIFQEWHDRLKTEFYGVTSDGKKKENLYPLQDEGAPTIQMTEAANRILTSWTASEKETGHLDLNSEDWRKWTNPELVILDAGLRLEKLEQQKVDLIMALLKASLSEVGYEKVEGSMKINEFLGEVCNSRGILNKHSYFFMLFGEPSETSPWGYTLTSHHLCLNVFVIEKQMTIGPVFIGAEPNDNRIIPYEGVSVEKMSTAQQEQLMSLVATFHELLPAEPLKHRLDLVRQHLPDTYFSWIGGWR
ncbi:hypothetical protein N7451_012728 [Penicillium sp. IBT 35674x]|nr:hypothetical protein N7451_012728 [Penicillium sp. IBT 35674x]